MDKFINFIFENKKYKVKFIRTFSTYELVYGVGKNKKSIKKIIDGYKVDGYIIIDTMSSEYDKSFITILK